MEFSDEWKALLFHFFGRLFWEANPFWGKNFKDTRQKLSSLHSVGDAEEKHLQLTCRTDLQNWFAELTCRSQLFLSRDWQSCCLIANKYCVFFPHYFQQWVTYLVIIAKRDFHSDTWNGICLWTMLLTRILRNPLETVRMLVECITLLWWRDVTTWTWTWTLQIKKKSHLSRLDGHLVFHSWKLSEVVHI